MSTPIIDLLPQLRGQINSFEGTPQIIICNANTLQKLSRSRQMHQSADVYNQKRDIGYLDGVEIITSPEVSDDFFRIF